MSPPNSIHATLIKNGRNSVWVPADWPDVVTVRSDHVTDEMVSEALAGWEDYMFAREASPSLAMRRALERALSATETP